MRSLPKPLQISVETIAKSKWLSLLLLVRAVKMRLGGLINTMKAKLSSLLLWLRESRDWDFAKRVW